MKTKSDKYLNRLFIALAVFIILFKVTLPKPEKKPLNTLKIGKEDEELNNGIQQGKHEYFNYKLKQITWNRQQ